MAPVYLTDSSSTSSPVAPVTNLTELVEAAPNSISPGPLITALPVPVTAPATTTVPLSAARVPLLARPLATNSSLKKSACRNPALVTAVGPLVGRDPGIDDQLPASECRDNAA